MRDAQRSMKFFLGSAPFTKWRKAGMLRVSQDHYKNRKNDLTSSVESGRRKVVISYLFLGFLMLPDFALLTGLEDA